MTEEVVWVPPQQKPDRSPGNPFTLTLVWIWIVALALGLVLLLTGALEAQSYSENESGPLLVGTFFTSIGFMAFLAWIAVKAVAWDRKNPEL